MPDSNNTLVDKLCVHLEISHHKVTPASEKRQAYRINIEEPLDYDLDSVDLYHQIIGFLDVEKSPRYKRQGSKTYCNIYAYDFCCYTTAYLPRVYWTDAAFGDILAGKEVAIEYGRTVSELSANKLYDFLVGKGKEYHNWEEVANGAELQHLANEGHVCIISAKRKDLATSGHITVVPPETEQFQMENSIPIQSQAGATNFKYKKRQSWYLGSQYSHYGFFVNKIVKTEIKNPRF